ncbi:MAG: TraE/TraK family type IV conjugative transfer system protein [Pseudoruegeria sp.]
MEFSALNRNLKTARRTRNILALVSFSLLCVTLLLSLTLARTTRTTVLVPTRISDGMVASGNVDPRYVEGLALDAVYAFYNTSPETTERSRTTVERLASTRHRAKLLEAFDEIANDIRERDISTVFFVQKIQTNIRDLEITVVGNLKTFINTTEIHTRRASVKVALTREASSARLASMEVISDETKGDTK